MSPFQSLLSACTISLSLAVFAAPVVSAQTPLVPFNSMPNILQDYIYGYAPVAMAAMRALMTAVPNATTFPGAAPVNQFGRVKTLAGPSERLIPSPNADTLYTLAWLDLTREPIVLHVPATAGRYYLIPAYDAYTNEFASIGSRTTGNGEGNYAIVGPLWRGTLPPELSGGFRAPTNTVWLIGRTLVRGEPDLADAVAVTDQYQLVPLSTFPSFEATGEYTPPSNAPVTPPNPDFIGFPVTNSAGFSKPEFFDYLKRAAIVQFGFGANIPADAVYPRAFTDITGNPLVGTKSYVMHFAPGQTPPARGFWSLTVYDENGFLVANPINRYSVGSETGLIPNPDGSLDIVLQNPAPTTMPSNWLPTPDGPFNLTLRLYWPEEPVLDGSYTIPAVEPLAAAVP